MASGTTRNTNLVPLKPLRSLLCLPFLKAGPSSSHFRAPLSLLWAPDLIGFPVSSMSGAASIFVTIASVLPSSSGKPSLWFCPQVPHWELVVVHAGPPFGLLLASLQEHFLVTADILRCTCLSCFV